VAVEGEGGREAERPRETRGASGTPEGRARKSKEEQRKKKRDEKERKPRGIGW
jgi:hypothetical protein